MELPPEDRAALAKRRAIQALMRNKALTPAQRHEKMQEINRGNFGADDDDDDASAGSRSYDSRGSSGAYSSSGSDRSDASGTDDGSEYGSSTDDEGAESLGLSEMGDSVGSRSQRTAGTSRSQHTAGTGRSQGTSRSQRTAGTSDAGAPPPAGGPAFQPKDKQKALLEVSRDKSLSAAERQARMKEIMQTPVRGWAAAAAAAETGKERRASYSRTASGKPSESWPGGGRGRADGPAIGTGGRATLGSILHVPRRPSRAPAHPVAEPPPTPHRSRAAAPQAAAAGRGRDLRAEHRLRPGAPRQRHGRGHAQVPVPVQRPLRRGGGPVPDAPAERGVRGRGAPRAEPHGRGRHAPAGRAGEVRRRDGPGPAAEPDRGRGLLGVGVHRVGQPPPREDQRGGELPGRRGDGRPRQGPPLQPDPRPPQRGGQQDRRRRRRRPGGGAGRERCVRQRARPGL